MLFDNVDLKKKKKKKIKVFFMNDLPSHEESNVN